MTIEARGLSKTFHGRAGVTHALVDVDLTIPTAEITAIVGHSGAGKTTFGRCVNLLERPTSGLVLIDGRNVWDLTKRERIATARTLGTIFQGSRLLRRRTALGNVLFPLELAGVPRDERVVRARRLLARVGLREKEDAYPSELSGGQAQRVGIARALALEPRVLISDEATSGLDPTSTESILELIKGIHADDGLTVVLITHEMDVVRALADRAVLFDGGRVVEQDTVGRLLADPASRLGRDLLPTRGARPRTADEAVFLVTYASGDVPADWIVAASAALGAPISVLSGSIEQLSTGSAGRLTITVPRHVAGRVPAALRRWGLTADGCPAPSGDDLAGAATDPRRPSPALGLR